MTSAAGLLDVNVLVALAWPTHVGHEKARNWFGEHADNGWATTPITESGFVRVCSNRRALPESTTPATAIDMLRRLRRLGTHEFWPDDVDLVVADRIDPHRLSGHRQVTDAHLLALTTGRGGRLVTFDRGLTDLALDPGHVDLLEISAS